MRVISVIIFVLHFASYAMAQMTPIAHSTLVFGLQEKHVHASSLVHLPNGDMLVVWFEGSGERTADDVKLMGARLPKGRPNWTAPFEMADTPNIPDCNPVLFLNSEQKLFLVWIAVQANRWEQSILKVRTSTDYSNAGAPIWQWQDNILLKPDENFAKEVTKRFNELPKSTKGWAGYSSSYEDMIIAASAEPMKRSIGWMTRIKPVVEGSNIILPLYSDGFNFSLMAISSDHGKTWQPSLPLVGKGPIQPAVVRKKNGDLVALLRDSGDEPSRVHYSESKDNGRSWSASTKTDIPNTASVELLVLKNGNWAFVGNDIADGRYKLALYISDNEGLSWKWKTYLENATDKKARFSYPSLIQTSDGLLHITYSYHPENNKKSIKYVVVDPIKIIK